MKLYSGPLSLFTAKVRVALAEKGLPYEKISVGWSLSDRYLPHHPDVVALNPKAEVPVLVDEGLVVYDSTIINEYLEERHPEPALFPSDAAARARCRQLEAAADEILFRSVWDLIEETFYPMTESERNPERKARAQKALGEHFARLDDELRGGDYLCGSFSVADIGTFIMVNATATLGVAPGPELERLVRWDARLRERPSIATEVGEMTNFVRSAFASAASP